MTETDLRIIHSKLDLLSERLDKLEVQFNKLLSKTEPDSNHFLEVGDFMEPGLPQKWT